MYLRCTLQRGGDGRQKPAEVNLRARVMCRARRRRLSECVPSAARVCVSCRLFGVLKSQNSPLSWQLITRSSWPRTYIRACGCIRVLASSYTLPVPTRICHSIWPRIVKRARGSWLPNYNYIHVFIYVDKNISVVESNTGVNIWYCIFKKISSSISGYIISIKSPTINRN